MSDNKPSNPQDDWKFWLVVNPAKWLMPMLYFVLLIAIVIHWVAFSVGLGWTLR